MCSRTYDHQDCPSSDEFEAGGDCRRLKGELLGNSCDRRHFKCQPPVKWFN